MSNNDHNKEQQPPAPSVNAPSLDFGLKCSECGEKIGIMSLFYPDMDPNYPEIPKHSTPEACCIKCLPKRLKDLEAAGFNKERIRKAREWLEG